MHIGGTLKTKVIFFLAQYFLHTYKNKDKAKRKLQQLTKEIPNTLVEDIEMRVDTLNVCPNYNELDLMSLCIIYTFIVLSFTTIVFLLLSLILY